MRVTEGRGALFLMRAPQSHNRALQGQDIMMDEGSSRSITHGHPDSSSVGAYRMNSGFD